MTYSTLNRAKDNSTEEDTKFMVKPLISVPEKYNIENSKMNEKYKGLLQCQRDQPTGKMLLVFVGIRRRAALLL